MRNKSHESKKYIRKYGKVAKVAFVLAFTIGGALVARRAIVGSQKFIISSFDYSGVVKFVNKSDFEAVTNSAVLGKNIITFDARELERDLKTNFLGIKSVGVKKIFPDKLSINILERVPLAICKDNKGEKFLIDLEGYVLGISADEYYDLPVIYLDEALRVGVSIDARAVPMTMKIITAAKLDEVSVTSLSFKPNYTEFYVPKSTQVLIANDKSVADGLKIVSRLISRARLEGKNIGKIDLRYGKVIVLCD